MIVEHGYRSYLFARALGSVEGIGCDDEALFAATMLHDYAFETMDTIADNCFTLVGAEVAADLLGRSRSRRRCSTTSSTRSRCTSTQACVESRATSSTSPTRASSST